MELPQLVIRDNAQRDADMVWRFLHHAQSPRYAQYIVKSHPEIEAFVNDENKVRAWVTEWHQKHEAEIRQLINDQEVIIAQEGERALALLGSFMDFTWEPGTTYTANISLLPFSPFEGNEFFYSALDDLSGKKKTGHSVLLVGIHEISHFIFFKYLGGASKHFGWTLGQDAIYFLKEALTTALMNLPEFRELFGTEPHRGNPELWNIFISQSPEPLLLVPWMEEKLKEMEKSGSKFSKWIIRIIQEFHTAEKEFSKRMQLWREHGPSLKNNPSLTEEYQESIRLE